MTWEKHLLEGNGLASEMTQASEKYGKNKTYRGVGWLLLSCIKAPRRCNKTLRRAAKG